jgi:succinyl-CoA:acetate CoA-transferase
MEADIYGFVNVTHLGGTRILNSIGGSAEFSRAGFISVFLTPSTAQGDKISRIVPMVPHVDVIDHDVDVLVTEQGCADLRGRSPREKAELIISKCAHPSYKEPLFDYYRRACEKTGGHLPHLLDEAFSWHLKHSKTGTMQKT